jgi:hypothetical protein
VIWGRYLFLYLLSTDASIETSPFVFHVIVGIKNGYASINVCFETKGTNVIFTSKNLLPLRDFIYFFASSKLASLSNHPTTPPCGPSTDDAYTIPQLSWSGKSDLIESFKSPVILIALLYHMIRRR